MNDRAERGIEAVRNVNDDDAQSFEENATDTIGDILHAVRSQYDPETARRVLDAAWIHFQAEDV